MTPDPARKSQFHFTVLRPRITHAHRRGLEGQMHVERSAGGFADGQTGAACTCPATTAWVQWATRSFRTTEVSKSSRSVSNTACSPPNEVALRGCVHEEAKVCWDQVLAESVPGRCRRRCRRRAKSDPLATVENGPPRS